MKVYVEREIKKSNRYLSRGRPGEPGSITSTSAKITVACAKGAHAFRVTRSDSERLGGEKYKTKYE